MRYKGIIEYIGEKYHGIQKQSHTNRTIAAIFENSIFQITKKNIELFYSGRTDAGVSATEQAIHFDLQNEKNLPIYKLINGVNYYLQNEDISLISLEETDENFHARFNAKQRIYKYYVNLTTAKPVHKKYTHFHFPYKIEVQNMIVAAEFLIGKHDFASFTKISESNIQKTTKTIDEISIEHSGNELIFTFKAKSFLHNMIRIFVGTLLEVGICKISPSYIKEILEAKDRRLAGKTIPAHGLFLYKTIY